jgi:RNA polymerase sigma-70 factor (ECF subfamily)
VRHRPPALAYARKLSGGSSVSDDLVAEAFLKTWQRLVGGRRVASFGPYLMRAVRNGYIDSLRRDRALTLETPQDVALHPAFTVADRSASVDDADLVRILFARMVPRHRHVIWLRAVEGYSTSEIAEALGIKANAAAVLLHRARKAMIAAYQDLDEASVA